MLIKIFITNYNSINNLFSTLVLEYYNKIIKINKNKNREKIIKMKKKKSSSCFNKYTIDLITKFFSRI